MYCIGTDVIECVVGVNPCDGVLRPKELIMIFAFSSSVGSPVSIQDRCTATHAAIATYNKMLSEFHPYSFHCYLFYFAVHYNDTHYHSW